MVPARVLRAAKYFRAKYNLPAPCVPEFTDYVNYHDAIHQFAGAPPTDEGELTAFEAEHAIRNMDHNFPNWEKFNRRYGHLFVGMRST